MTGSRPSVLYVVRSRFLDPEREHAWNEWYAGHIDVLLGVPGFIAAQRFHSGRTVDDRPYLAMYEVAGAEVFTSEPYRAIWGFDEWRPLIDHWTRDIFEPIDGGAIDFATAPEALLWADFVSGEERAVARSLERLGTGSSAAHTAAIAGLDRSCGGIAWRVIGDRTREPCTSDLDEVHSAEAVYTPLIEFRRAES